MVQKQLYIIQLGVSSILLEVCTINLYYDPKLYEQWVKHKQ